MRKNAQNFVQFFIAVALASAFSCNCSSYEDRHRENLKGDWILIGDQWHPGIRITEDSVFAMYERNGFLTPLQEFGQPYRLTEDDSLIFGLPLDTNNHFGINKQLRGSWKIIKLTPDSLIVEDFLGLKRFCKTKKQAGSN